MAFCSNCGAAVADGIRFCPQCGREVGAAAPASPAPASPATAPTGVVTASGLTKNVAGLLCYVLGFITGIIFLVLEPYNRDSFVRFHAFQSIFFNVATIAAFIVVGMIPVVNFILAPILMLGCLAIWIILMLQAYQNKKWKLPFIGDLAEKQG